MTRRLILLRHGQTHYNATMRMQGQLDTTLSEQGRKQASLAADAIAQRHPSALYSSDLQRARHTADAIGDATGLDVHVDSRLRETNLGEWQGMSHLEVDEKWPGARKQWRSAPQWAPPGGESRIEVAARTRAVVDELIDADADWANHPVVMVAHGGAIAALAAALLELSVESFPLFNGLGNTAWAQLSAHDRGPESVTDSPAAVPPTTVAAEKIRWRLDAWNVAPHLEMR